MGIDGPKDKGASTKTPQTPTQEKPSRPSLLQNSPQFLRIRNQGASEPVRTSFDFQGQSREQASAEEVVEGLRGRLGSPDLALDHLRSLSSQLVAEHVMILLANQRAKNSRAEVLHEVSELLMAMNQPERINKILGLMPQVGRIVDIYPLEVLAYILERAPQLLSKHEFRGFIRNREELQSKPYGVGIPIEIRVPLALKMRAFALQKGGYPGYTFAPGPPGIYWLELGGAGQFEFLLRGEIRKNSYIDRLSLEIQHIDPKE